MIPFRAIPVPPGPGARPPGGGAAHATRPIPVFPDFRRRKFANFRTRRPALLAGCPENSEAGSPRGSRPNRNRLPARKRAGLWRSRSARAKAAQYSQVERNKARPAPRREPAKADQVMHETVAGSPRGAGQSGPGCLRESEGDPGGAGHPKRGKHDPDR